MDESLLARPHLPPGPGVAWALFLEVVEVRARELNKGRALEVLIRQPAFAGRIPVFVGDDLTDEDGFKAAERLGGHAIAVGHERVEVTRYWLPEPEAVRHWLQRLATDIRWHDHAAEAPCKI